MLKRVAMAVALLALTIPMWSGGAAAAPDDCTIEGTAGPDELVGTGGADVICGKGGRDDIEGKGGHDVLIGGDGGDTLVGGPGNDVLDGGGGPDGFFNGDGRDVIYGATGEDRHYFGAGDDRHYGEGGRDFLNDLKGDDEMYGGPGNDFCLGSFDSHPGDLVNGGPGVDVYFSDPGDDRVSVEDEIVCFGSDAGAPDRPLGRARRARRRRGGTDAHRLGRRLHDHRHAGARRPDGHARG